ncbi:MAG: MFS transporter, partial [Microbacteriaceae bacterium]
IIGWSLGGLLGPPIIAALIGTNKAYTLGYTVIGIIALVALVLPAITRMPTPRADAVTVAEAGAPVPGTLAG